jgi:hypothetical protein
MWIPLLLHVGPSFCFVGKMKSVSIFLTYMKYLKECPDSHGAGTVKNKHQSVRAVGAVLHPSGIRYLMDGDMFKMSVICFSLWFYFLDVVLFTSLCPAVGHHFDGVDHEGQVLYTALTTHCHAAS